MAKRLKLAFEGDLEDMALAQLASYGQRPAQDFHTRVRNAVNAAHRTAFQARPSMGTPETSSKEKMQGKMDQRSDMARAKKVLLTAAKLGSDRFNELVPYRAGALRPYSASDPKKVWELDAKLEKVSSPELRAALRRLGLDD